MYAFGPFHYPYDNEDELIGFYLAVFTFGYLQYDLIAHNVPPSVERTLSMSEIAENFAKWQTKLGLAEVNRRTDVRVKGAPLFSFTDDERIVAWRHVAPTAS